MAGWLYLVRNGDLYKIGITKNFKNRMRQLKPDQIVVKFYSSNFKQLEKDLHKRYKKVRIPQTEYFRLDKYQVNDFKRIISNLYFNSSFILRIFIESFILISFSFMLIILYISLVDNDINDVFFRSLLWTEKISYALSLISIIKKSRNKLNFINELKFRFLRISIFILFSLLLNLIRHF